MLIYAYNVYVSGIKKDKNISLCLFVLMLYLQLNNFQSCLDDFLSCWDEPDLSSG